MAPSPIPAPLPPWARAALYIAPLIPGALQFVLEHIGAMSDGSSESESSWRQVQVVFKDPADADMANTAIFTMDIANITQGKLDSTWTDQDYSMVDGHISTLVAGYCPWLDPRIRHVERRYYRKAFAPMPPPDVLPGDVPSFLPAGAPERIFADSQPGTGTSSLPPQCSISVTEKTAYSGHWGRFYLPFPAGGTVGSRGTIAAAPQTAIATSVADQYTALQQAEFFPVIPYTQVGKKIARGLLTVSEIQVDNVFDVIRRRRTHSATSRIVLPVT